MSKITLIVSDIHLNSEFNQNKFNYLKQLFQSCDQLILLGDFWSYYSTTFDQFVNSKWRGLFEVMLEKNTIYIFGNHDREEWSDSRRNLFSIQSGNSFSLSLQGKTFHLEHGHLIAGDSIYKYKYVDLIRTIRFDKLVYLIHSKILKIFGMTYYSKFGTKLNIEYKKRAGSLKGKVLITGHSHSPEIDLENNYLNSGFILFGKASYILIEKEKISLKKENYY